MSKITAEYLCAGLAFTFAAGCVASLLARAHRMSWLHEPIYMGAKEGRGFVCGRTLLALPEFRLALGIRFAVLGFAGAMRRP